MVQLVSVFGVQMGLLSVHPDRLSGSVPLEVVLPNLIPFDVGVSMTKKYEVKLCRMYGDASVKR